jgi:arginine utilization regulatory protein
MGSLKGSYTGATDKPGMFKTAHGGTLFIDELQDLSVEHQAKLRDFLDTKMIRAVGSIKYERLNVRIILGMNQNPQQMVQEGRFRADLFRRLGRNVIHVPPLRERKEDIPELARYAVRRICQKYELECKELKPEALILLREYDWPWNVGELQSVIENAVRSLLRYCRSGV